MLKLRTRRAIIVRLEGSDRLHRPTPLSVSNGDVGRRKGSIVYMATRRVDKRRKKSLDVYGQKKRGAESSEIPSQATTRQNTFMNLKHKYPLSCIVKLISIQSIWYILRRSSLEKKSFINHGIK
jgi:hypothetical protein